MFDVLVALGVAGVAAVDLSRPSLASIGFVMSGVLLFRRVWPLPTLAVVSAAALAQVLLFQPTNDPVPYDAAVLIAMYSVVKYGRSAWHGVVAGVVVAVGIVIEVARHFTSRWWTLAILYLGICTATWLTASAMRARRAYIAGLEERAATLEREREHLARIAVAEERALIAREMHDVVAHSLAVIIVQADGGRYAMASDPGKARIALQTVADTGREAMTEMRRLIDLLRAGGMSEPSNGDDLRTVGLAQVPALIDRARSAGLTVDVTTAGTPTAADPMQDLTAYRIIQEALTNVLRHAEGSARVEVAVRCDDAGIDVLVVDDGGVGGTASIDGDSGRVGHGLVGMRERVAVHGGMFTAGPRQSGGWAVTARIPAAAPTSAIAAAPAPTPEATPCSPSPLAMPIGTTVPARASAPTTSATTAAASG